MRNLDEKDWKPFLMSEIFDSFIRGKVTSATDEPKCSYGIPYVGATDKNNGVLDFLELNDKKVQPGNCITFIRDGQGSVGSSIYRATPCIATVNTSSAYAEWLNESNGIFVSTASNQVRTKYSFGYKRKEERLIAERIMLPTTDNGTPDYCYMAEYTRNHRISMLEKYKAFAQEQIQELEYKSIPRLEEKEWHEFPLDDIFTVYSGKRLENRNKYAGKRPFIGATDNNNGVTGFIGNENASKDKNVLGVNYNGAPCIAFFHPYECIFTDDVKRLHLRKYDDTKYVLLFFIAIIGKQRSKFNYGYKFKEQRMLRQKLMLPIKDTGEPDYDYMEQYAKNIMLKKYQQYLNFLETKYK